jgi:hypothetical protein
MAPLLQRVSTYLRRWAGKKYKRLRTYTRFKRWWTGLLDREPGLFAHWQWVRAYWPAGEKSPVTGDCHAGIRGSRGLRRPRPPDPLKVSGARFRCADRPPDPRFPSHGMA